jgi:hypothetical protein
MTITHRGHTIDVRDDFKMSLRAFNLFTDAEKLATLREFASLKYPHIEDRFFEAVHRVITRKPEEP